MADKKPTQEQDELNNHLIACKKYSDANPRHRAAFTVFVDADGDLFLTTKAPAVTIRLIAEELCNAQRIEKDGTKQG